MVAVRRATTVAATPLAKNSVRPEHCPLRWLDCAVETQGRYEGRSTDRHRPTEWNGKYDNGSDGHKKHDGQMPLIKLATGVNAHHGDRQEDEKNSREEENSLHPQSMRPQEGHRGDKSRGGKDRRWPKHRHDGFSRKQDRVEAQRQDVEHDNPDHPRANDLGSPRPGAFAKKPSQFPIEADITRASTEQALDLLDNGRAQPLQRFPRRRPYRSDRSCGSLGIHVSDLGSRRPEARRAANSAPKTICLP